MPALNMAGRRSRADLASESMLAMALTRCLEVRGEAASKLSPEARLRFPNIPCTRMTSMRNRLIHATSTWISISSGRLFLKTSRHCYRFRVCPGSNRSLRIRPAGRNAGRNVPCSMAWKRPCATRNVAARFKPGPGSCRSLRCWPRNGPLPPFSAQGTR